MSLPRHLYKVANFENKAKGRTERNICNSSGSKRNSMSNTQSSLSNQAQKKQLDRKQSKAL